MPCFLSDEGGGLGLHLTSITSSARSAYSLQSISWRVYALASGVRLFAVLSSKTKEKSDAVLTEEALETATTGAVLYFLLEQSLKLGLEEFSAPLFRGQRSQ